MKPRVFVGSSVEKLDIAYAIQQNLQYKADVTVWTQGVFSPMSNTLDDLLKELDNSDFGVFVFAPEDIVQIRDKHLPSVRDNVLFEFGMFIGRLGKERTFFILPRDQQGFHLLTDLSGVNPATFDSSRENLQAALGPSCFQIQQAIQKLGIRKDRVDEVDVEKITNPRILCAASSQFEDMGFEEDVAVIKEAFPEATISVEHNLSSDRLRGLLMGNQFDILHFLTYVHPKTGETVLSDINIETEEVTGDDLDVISAEGFSKLVGFCKARLIVLASCNSLLLAAYLAPHVNMIASTGWVYTKAIVKWEKSFYQCLARGTPLSVSSEIANAMSKAPMIRLMKKDVAFA